MKSTDTLLFTVISILLALSGYAQNTPFSSATIPPFTTDNFQSFVIDYDNDGDDDIVGWQHALNNTSKIYRNNGNSTFTDVSSPLNFPAKNSGIAADIDKNGYMDVYYIDSDTLQFTLNSGTAFRLPNTPCSRFLLSQLFNTPFTNVKTVKLGDFDADGFYDIVAHIITGSSSEIKGIKGLHSCDSCGFGWKSQPAQTLVSLSSAVDTRLQFADLDNDSDFDLLVGENGGFYSDCDYSIYLNNGSGSFAFYPGSGYTVGRESAFATLGDFNNDGFTDIMSGARDCCLGGNPLYSYFSTGTGTFTQSTTAIQRSQNPYYEGATVVDINLDRKLDVLWTNMVAISSSQLQCFINNGNHAFTQSAAALDINYGSTNGACCPIQNTQVTTLIDLNHDFKPDLDIHQIDNVAPYTVVSKWQRINTLANNAIKLRLEACTGLREGWGARIGYKTGGSWSYQQHTGYSGANYPFLYLGMGANTNIDSLVIRWMGGVVTTLTNLSANQYLKVEENPNCTYIFTQPGAVNLVAEDSVSACGDSVSVHAVSGLSNYQWSNGENTAAVFVHSTGNYFVSASGGSGCTFADTVHVQLASPLYLIADGLICAGDSITLNAGTGTSYLWSTGDTISFITVSPTENSSYSVSISGVSNCGHTMFAVAIRPKFPAGTIIPADDTVCTGASVVLTTTGSASDIQWQSSLSGQEFTNITGATDTLFTTAIAQNTYFRVFRPDDACTDTSNVLQISVYPLPVPEITVEDTLICASDSTQAICTGTYSSYIWNNGDTGSFTFIKNAGGVWVTVTDNNGCSAISNRENVSVYPATSISIIIQGDTLASFNATSYQWYRNDTLIPHAAIAVYVAEQTGYYSLEIIDDNGCKVRSSQVFVAVLGLNDIDPGVAFDIYPVPLSDYLVIRSNRSDLKIYGIEILNALGQKVYESKNENFTTGYIKADIPYLGGGLYFLKISSNQTVPFVRSIFKE